MINLFDLFSEKLIFNEIGESPIKIAVPISSIIVSSKEKLVDSTQNILPTSLIKIYEQISFINIMWNLSSRVGSGIEKFKEDPWIKENYLNNDYDWSIIHEYLSGYINITKSKDLFNPTFCKEQAYYYTINSLNENADDFFAFDIHWSLTACLKKEGNNIIDNIWLVHSDAETMYDMKITLENYLNLAYKAKGFHYWQLIFILKEETFYHEFMKRFLPQMLPNVDLDLKDFDI